MNHSAAVLRNKGVCVEVNETFLSEDGVWEVARDEDGAAKSVKSWIRFDGNSLADLEEAYGDLGQYQIATSTNPWRAIRRTFAIVFGWDDLHPPVAPGEQDTGARLCSGCRRAGLAMREGGVNAYSNAVGAALALANGLDPTKAVQLLEMGAKATSDLNAARDVALSEMLDGVEKDQAAAEADESTSTDGSELGSELAEATTSSGD